jgi:hypothetical protein
MAITGWIIPPQHTNPSPKKLALNLCQFERMPPFQHFKKPSQKFHEGISRLNITLFVVPVPIFSVWNVELVAT